MSTVTVRFLGLDFWLDDERVDFAQYRDSSSMLEYDVVLWDPSALLSGRLGPGQFEGCPALDRDETARYESDIERRSTEIENFLALGRLLVIFLPAPDKFFVFNHRENRGTPGKPNWTNILSARTLADAIVPRVSLFGSHGSRMRPAVGEPFSSFWRAVRDDFEYRAYLTEAIGTTLLVLEGTDHPVGALVEHRAGKVLLLPQLADPQVLDAEVGGRRGSDAWHGRREQLLEERRVAQYLRFMDAAVSLFQEIQLDRAELPPWTDSIQLPGEAEARAKECDAAEQVQRAEATLMASRSALSDVRELKRLLTESGRALELAVYEALARMGCKVEEGRAGRTDHIVRWRNAIAVVEVKGLTKSAAEKDAAQLEKWVSEFIEEHGQVPKAVLIANTWRRKPLEARDVAFPDQMVPYATQRGHCLIETHQLLAALTGPVERQEVFLSSMFSTKGRLPEFGLLT